MFQNINLLQDGEISFNGTLAHRQYLRHLATAYCRRFFDENEDFLLTFSEFRFRHISVMVSDMQCVDRGKDDGLKLSWSRFEYRF